MADILGDKDKQPKYCKENTSCSNIINIYEGYDTETRSCKVCGAYFKLYYDDMQ